MQGTIAAQPRHCFYIPPDQRDANGYIPSVVTEGIRGHRPLTGNGEASQQPWGATYAEAAHICDPTTVGTFNLTPADAAERPGVSQRGLQSRPSRRPLVRTEGSVGRP